MVEFVFRSGAKPYDQRRHEINEEREAKGELPISNEEFMGIVYNPDQPAVQDLQKKVKNARAKLAPEFELLDQPISPRSLREFEHKKDVIVFANARSPRKGMLNLYPQNTVAELLGARDTLQVIKKQKVTANSQSVIDVPDEVYMMMSEVLEAVSRMVSSLPTREVKQSVLDVEVHKLAVAGLPNPSQESMCNHYVRTTNGLLGQILKDIDKIILKEMVPNNGKKKFKAVMKMAVMKMKTKTLMQQTIRYFRHAFYITLVLSA
ncbi:uncharacterized protein LOC141719080 [Apium graveolens]|uniref:uncharacterized protein LOC141719080 n=1 Tax=Apium graveolens TaxID=4045 RepID=UPI003D7B54E8